MQDNPIRLNMRRLTFITLMTTMTLFVTVITSYGESNAIVTPKWQKSDMPARCSSSANCEISSPVLADLTGDDIDDVVIATSNGWLIAVKNDGTELWRRDTALEFGMSANSQQINSSPAVADINNDGQPEIVVGTGTKSTATCTQGGLIAYDRNGNFLWRFLAADEFVPPSGCADTIYATPALGDLDKDGDLEIVAAGFDKRIYVLHHNGSLDPNFPIDSAHSVRFPDWDGLNGHLADTIWGSPSLADMDGDGYLDIILGTDEGNFDDNFPNGEGWDCPYEIPPHPWPRDYCGGALYVIDRFGNHLPGFPKRIHETMQSSPAVVDIDSDGSPEIFVGAGTFYYNNSPDNPSLDFRIYGWDNEGNDLPGWSGGMMTGGSTPASVAVGDITGNGDAEVVALSMDRKIYAWTKSGATVSGFPKTPMDMFGTSTFDVGFTPILGDYDGDGKMEIFVRVGWDIVIVDGNGQILTATQANSGAPRYYAEALLQNNPAVGNIDGDPALELIAQNSDLFAWDMAGAGTEADWPMFRYNAARTGHPVVPTLHVSPISFVKLHDIDDSDDVVLTMQVFGSGGEEIDWSASGSSGVSASPDNGQVNGAATTVTVTIDRDSLNNGQNNKSITFSGEIGGDAVANSPIQVPITIYLVDEVYDAFLPSVLK